MHPRKPQNVRILPDESVFHSRSCAEVYAAACALADEGKPIDTVTLQARCGASSGFLREAMEVCPTAANAGYHAEVVLEGYQWRRLEKIAADMAAAESPGEGIAAGLAALEALANAERSGSAPGGDLAALLQYRAELEEGARKVLQFGFPAVDRILGGLLPGGLYTVGARTSVGKSAFGIAAAEMLAQRGHRVAYVSLEMSRAEIAARRIAACAGNAFGYTEVLNRQHFSEAENAALAATAAKLSGRPLEVVERHSLTANQAELLARSAGAQVLIVDYLGLMSGRGKDEYERITGISGDLKRLAKRLNIVVIVLCQINREAERSPDARPHLSQLRSSGAIEQDADGVLLLHRPELGKGQPSEPFEVNIAKNRHGGTGTATLAFYPAVNRFEDSGQIGGRPYTVRSWS